MENQKNLILAIALSSVVMIVWHLFVNVPQMEKQRQQLQEQAQKSAQQTPPAAPAAPGSPAQPQAQDSRVPQAPAQPGAAGTVPSAVPGQQRPRAAVLAETPRVKINTPIVAGSISLKGARIDDLSLVKYRETVDPKSAAIVLLAPSGAPDALYGEFGWVPTAGTQAKLPTSETLWRQEGSNELGVGQPVKLVYDNGEGLEFRRTIAVDENYLFTVNDEVANKGSAPVSLAAYALISRHGTPVSAGYAVLHEGPIGVMGDKCLRQGGFSLFKECQEESYKTLEDKEKEKDPEKKQLSFQVKNAWFGFTDKYWSAVLLPDTNANLNAHFSSGQNGTLRTYQADYVLDAQTIAPGATGSAFARLFAGAREVSTIDFYDNSLKLNRFELLIEWGHFYFITKPMFWSLDWLYRLTGNFGIAILLITVIVKFLFLPLANKSYASMAKMKAVQPKMTEIRERFPDDKVKQQQAMMELYKSEQINPLAGCLPIAIQIPVFFSLYKVLYVTIEMRHAPFFGWIHDLSAPDPTNLFNLFGLIPYDPTTWSIIGPYLHLGIWPIIMGITMWFQMKLNPAPPDPTQKMIFDWMPLLFTFMLASFPAGLVIYWAWNNTLSVAQQAFIMNRHGAKIELFDNLKRDLGGLFGGKKNDDDDKKDGK